MRWPRFLAMTAPLVGAGLFGASLYFVWNHLEPAAIPYLLIPAAVGAGVLWMGVVIGRRAPDNWVAPVLGLMGIEAFVLVGTDSLGAAPAPGAVVALSQGIWMWFYVPVGLLLALFPTGRVANRSGLVAVVGLPVVAATFQFAAAFPTDRYMPPNEDQPHVFPDSPAATALAWACLPVFLVMLVTAATSMVQRYRRGDAVTRSQVRWLMLAGGALPLTLLLCWLSYLVLGGPDLVLLGLGLMYVALPAATVVAVLRHDLYDVDDAVVAAAAVGLVATVLLGVFTLVSIGAGLLVGRDSVAVAVTVTAVAAFVLGSVRRRVQAAIAHALFPVRQRALRAVEELRRRVDEGRAEPEEVVPVLAGALRDPGLTVSYAATLPPGPDGRTTPITLGGTTVGYFRSGSQARHRPSRDVAEAAALLVETARLRQELAGALHEIEASRERILLAGYDERRRLERDLHDGAQQRLVSLGVSLRLLQRTLPARHQVLQGELDGAVAQIATAVSELRLLAHGIRPSSLDDGLDVALAQLARTTPVPLELDLSGLDAGADLPDGVSTTAYFVAAEAVTNAIKYANAKRIQVQVRQDDGHVSIRIADDGLGGARPRPGSGLVGLSDRVEAAGGRFNVHSPEGSGTTVEAVMPCGS